MPETPSIPMVKSAALEKLAKLLVDMTPSEREAALKIRDELRKGTAPLRKPRARTIGEKASRTGKAFLNNLAAAGAITGLRAGEDAVRFATFVPELADKFILGGALGIGRGNGLFGSHLGRFHRYIDKKVHGLRQAAEDYEYRNRIDSGLNRFLRGAAADTAGAFIGFGGLGGLTSKSLLAPALAGGFASWDSLSDGQKRQLREREETMRKLRRHGFDKHMDPTSTAYNQENSPTPEEYRRYNAPRDLPPAWGGKIRIPTAWRTPSSLFSGSGAPLVFRPYGT